MSTKRFAFLNLFIYFVLTYVYVSSLLLSSENKALLIVYSMRLEITRIKSH